MEPEPKWHVMSYKEILQGIPKRMLGLVSKIVGVKMLIFVVATWLMMRGTLESWAWMVIALVVIFGREALKYISEIRK